MFSLSRLFDLVAPSDEESLDPLTTQSGRVPAVATPATVVSEWDFETQCRHHVVEVVTFLAEHRLLKDIDWMKTYSWEPTTLGPKSAQLNKELNAVAAEQYTEDGILLQEITHTYGGDERISYYPRENTERQLDETFEAVGRERDPIVEVVNDVFTEYAYESGFNHWGALDEAVDVSPKYRHESRFH